MVVEIDDYDLGRIVVEVRAILTDMKHKVLKFCDTTEIGVCTVYEPGITLISTKNEVWFLPAESNAKMYTIVINETDYIKLDETKGKSKMLGKIEHISADSLKLIDIVKSSV